MNEIERPSRSAIELAGQAANQAAAQHVFDDYRSRRPVNTLRAQDSDLQLFRECLSELHITIQGDLANDSFAWSGMTWGLVQAFVKWMLHMEYSIGTINRALSTVKMYAGLAHQSGVVESSEHALIRGVKGYSNKDRRHVDEKREDDGKRTRWEKSKKAEHVSIDDESADTLKNGHPDTPQGRRDALLMCLLLDHGLRCGEVALLQVADFNLKRGEFRFYRPKVNKKQTHRMTKDTRQALAAWVENGHCPEMASDLILRASTKNGNLVDVKTATRINRITGLEESYRTGSMSDRAITQRVHDLGKMLGLRGLSAHDCRHYWATRAARKHTDPFSLQEAGGWNSLVMPRRYVEEARIANEGVKLE